MTRRDDDGGDERTTAEQRLAHLAAVVEASSDAIVSKSLDGTITSWNVSAERMFGYSAVEIVGQNVRRLIPPERQAEEDEILEKLRAGVQIEHYETVRLTKDGRRIDVSLSISPVKDSAGRIVGASKIARDITARRLAEEALRQSEKRFRSITSDHRRTWCGRPTRPVGVLPPQPAWESYTGQGPDVYGGHGWLQALHAEDREPVRAAWHAATANATKFEADGRLWSAAAGEHRHVVVRATPIRREDGSIGEWVGGVLRRPRADTRRGGVPQARGGGARDRRRPATRAAARTARRSRGGSPSPRATRRAATRSRSAATGTTRSGSRTAGSP